MTYSDATAAQSARSAAALVGRTWWVFLFGGLATLAFGVLALLAPGLALVVLGAYFAAAVLLDGVIALLGAWQHRDKDGWRVMGLLGAIGIAIGAYALANPPAAIAVFVVVVALQAIVLGALVVMLGYRVRRVASHEWVLYLTGVLSVAFGLIVLADPVAGTFPVVTLIAFWAIVTGATRAVFGLQLRIQPPGWVRATGGAA